METVLRKLEYKGHIITKLRSRGLEYYELDGNGIYFKLKQAKMDADILNFSEDELKNIVLFGYDDMFEISELSVKAAYSPLDNRVVLNIRAICKDGTEINGKGCENFHSNYMSIYGAIPRGI